MKNEATDSSGERLRFVQPSQQRPGSPCRILIKSETKNHSETAPSAVNFIERNLLDEGDAELHAEKVLYRQDRKFFDISE